MSDGESDGDSDGLSDGTSDGTSDGLSDGDKEGEFDGFVFDPPYGRNAWKSSDGFDLFEGALNSCAKSAAEKANLVTLIPWPPESIFKPFESGISFGKDWQEIHNAFVDSGWRIKSTNAIRVHRSLARLLIHAERK